MEKLFAPQHASKILLHSCCAPCSGGIITMLREAGIDCTVFFYNPNIHPQDEYEKRKGEIIRFVTKHGVPFVDMDYEPEIWQGRIKGLENEPERGQRCQACFDLRLERAALWAHDNGFSVFATTLAASRWKDLSQVNAAGQKAASRHSGLVYWEHNWRKGGGSLLMDQISRQENFYRQTYCGCSFSKFSRK